MRYESPVKQVWR